VSPGLHAFDFNFMDAVLAGLFDPR